MPASANPARASTETSTGSSTSSSAPPDYRVGSLAVVAGANLAVQSRDWPAARITRELRPIMRQTCEEISRLLGCRGGD